MGVVEAFVQILGFTFKQTGKIAHTHVLTRPIEQVTGPKMGTLFASFQALGKGNLGKLHIFMHILFRFGLIEYASKFLSR